MLSSRPPLIYDGDCGFCRVWIARWRREPRALYCPVLTLDGDRLVAAPPQLPGG